MPDSPGVGYSPNIKTVIAGVLAVGGLVLGYTKFTNYVDYAEIATPTPPAAGIVRFYPKSDGKFYKQTPDAVETEVGGGGGSDLTAVSGNIIPDADLNAGRNIGSSAFRWYNVYAQSFAGYYLYDTTGITAVASLNASSDNTFRSLMDFIPGADETMNLGNSDMKWSETHTNTAHVNAHVELRAAVASPASPAAGYLRVFAKNQGVYSLNEWGAERDLTAPDIANIVGTFNSANAPIKLDANTQVPINIVPTFDSYYFLGDLTGRFWQNVYSNNFTGSFINSQDGTIALRINGDTSQVTADYSLVPTTDNITDLGSASKRWVKTYSEYLISQDDSKGLVLKSPNGHFWRISVSNVGVLTTSDLGTTVP